MICLRVVIYCQLVTIFSLPSVLLSLRMIDKIISGGQTGADRAALDIAIELGIPHGGWIPKGRKAEDGRLPDKYRLSETSTIDYNQRTELNIIDSEGTLIFSHGAPTGGSAFTQQMAKKHHRPCLHIDLNEIEESKAVQIIASWIGTRKMKILNVAGSSASKDSAIYDAVKRILGSVFAPPPEHIVQPFPTTTQEAVKRLIVELSLKEKTNIARMEENDLASLYDAMGKYIMEKFGLLSGNEELMESCRFVSIKYGIHYDLHEEDASALIIREMWRELQKSYALRTVK